ncbi:MAG TPA: GntR family transcriptional regulator, partial [Armatimonadetes bacterium]|nr:GntR family transcriptional regulator [Armatimonadota bacterium]
MGLRPVAKNTLVSQVVESLKTYIINGGFKAGDKLLSEKELCSRLSVSRT